MKIVSELEASLKKYPPIPPGTPDLILRHSQE
jgi:hypothetical protein